MKPPLLHPKKASILSPFLSYCHHEVVTPKLAQLKCKSGLRRSNVTSLRTAIHKLRKGIGNMAPELINLARVQGLRIAQRRKQHIIVLYREESIRYLYPPRIFVVKRGCKYGRLTRRVELECTSPCGKSMLVYWVRLAMTMG
jgi:hypothetical protein